MSSFYYFLQNSNPHTLELLWMIKCFYIWNIGLVIQVNIKTNNMSNDSLLWHHYQFNFCISQFTTNLRGCSYGGELARLRGLDDFYPTFTWNLLSQFNQKVCYVAGKRLFDQVFFTIGWRKAIMQNKCSYII